MRSYAVLTAVLVGLLLASFALFLKLDLAILSDPRPWLAETGRWAAAGIGLGLLVGDVILPIPASLVMIANGALFGVLVGALLSWTGGVAASATAFAVGRGGAGWLRRRVPSRDRRCADELLARWGDAAVVATRPVPILAESVAVVAGTTSLRWSRFLVAAALGNLPAALVYALFGAGAARLPSGYLVLGLVLLVAGVVALAGQKTRIPMATRKGATP